MSVELILFVESLVLFALAWDIRKQRNRSELLAGSIRSLRHQVAIMQQRPKLHGGKPKNSGKKYTFEGLTHTMYEWEKMTGVKRNTMYVRMYHKKPMLTPNEFARRGVLKGLEEIG